MFQKQIRCAAQGETGHHMQAAGLLMLLLTAQLTSVHTHRYKIRVSVSSCEVSRTFLQTRVQSHVSTYIRCVSEPRWFCVTSLSRTPPDIFRRPQDLVDLQPCLWWQKPKGDLFTTPGECQCSLNRTRSEAQRCHNMKMKLEPEEMSSVSWALLNFQTRTVLWRLLEICDRRHFTALKQDRRGYWDGYKVVALAFTHRTHSQTQI